VRVSDRAEPHPDPDGASAEPEPGTLAPAASRALGGFDPAVAAWFGRAFPSGATDAQARAWAAARAGGHVLVSAPTGSGKTLAAFLAALDELVVRGSAAPLPDAVQVLYVSPLKALSNDIEKNLQAPLNGIRDALFEQGRGDVGIRTAVRTGDTSASERALIRKLPPHVLVTTPESLFILLTSDSGRAMLAGVRTVIVDELHALAGSKRGAHLMLSLERLSALCPAPPMRIGLSATVKPIEAVAAYLVGAAAAGMPGGAAGAGDADRTPVPGCTIVDAGHVRRRDIALELPRSALTPVMSNEIWGELYDRLAALAASHRTTLIFVNQRRIAERVARHLAERLGEQYVTAHHGSLAKEHRFDAEQRLKAGTLKALVATSSLELGIDIGDVDLVCQMGSPRWISAFLQRVGRAGHAIGAVPKGRLFPLTLDDLHECAALLDAVRRGELDRGRDIGAPLDVLAQQLLAEVGCGEWREQDLFDLVRRAAPYRDLSRADFDGVVKMLAEGYATRRGRRGAWLHHDGINGRLRPRRGARLVAVTNAGVIPDQFDCDVVLLPEGLRIGSLNEDFAFDSVPGDIFQLGNTAYRIAKVETGKVYVEDARGQPPSLPFWFGEALGRSDELSAAVCRLSAAIEAELVDGSAATGGTGEAHGCAPVVADDGAPGAAGPPRGDSPYLRGIDLPLAARQQLVHHLATARAALGALPGTDTIVIERFFDEVGDAHMVIHSPHGSRINKAWGLALRKRFCRTFNFELQASALEDSIILSLGPTHSFALGDVARYLHPASARDVLVQALLDVPMFPTRFRWSASIALAIRRMNGGKRVPPQFQRSDAEDLLTVVFPDQVACAENLTGPREIPGHPLVAQTLHDCLYDTMDVEGYLRLLQGLTDGRIRVVCADLVAPSPLAGAILNARPYAFLDDGEAEERRTRSVTPTGELDLAAAAALGRLDPAAIAAVREEATPLVRDADELHDALVVHGFLTTDEVGRLGAAWRAPLLAAGRAFVVEGPAGPVLVAMERAAQFAAAVPGAAVPVPAGAVPEPPDAALAELVRGRLELLGPTTAAALAAPLPLPVARIDAALARLEGEGSAMRGRFDPGLDGDPQWCDRRLLARIHRLCRSQRRARVQSVPPARFLDFLTVWQGLGGTAADDAGVDHRREGEAGLLAVLQQLEGWAAPAIAWERDLLPLRVRDYQPALLDRLCASGRIAWWRPRGGDGDGQARAAPVRATPILLAERTHLAHWRSLAAGQADPATLGGQARRLLEALRSHGAQFASDLEHSTGLLRAELEPALAELVSQGLVSCDSFAGLRALLLPQALRGRLGRRALPPDLDHAGRWSLVPALRAGAAAPAGALADPAVEHVARVLLRRYGVVFRSLLSREQNLPPWRELHYVYRRLEAREEVLGGRFVEAMAGEQFALPEAAQALRGMAGDTGLRTLSGSDPLNLLGVLTPDAKVPATARNRILLRGGIAVAKRAGGRIEVLTPAADPASDWAWRTALQRDRPAPPG
jgi:ATP-dependent Lhr-like helicase